MAIWSTAISEDCTNCGAHNDTLVEVEWPKSMLRFTILKNNPPEIGSRIEYSYDIASRYTGTAVIKGYYGKEVWLHMETGTNHHGTENFIISYNII